MNHARRFFVAPILALVCPLAALLPLARGQHTQLGGPPSVWVFDAATRSIRPLLGVPGAAYLGPAALTEIEAAAVSPDGVRILMAREGRTFLAASGPSGELVASAIEDAIAAPDRFVWAADSCAALLYSEARREVQRLSLADTLRADPPADLSAIEGRITALALASATGPVLLGVAGAESGGIFLIRAGSSIRRLAAVAHPSAIIFGPDENDVFVADRGARRISHLRRIDGALEVSPVFDERAGIEDPVGLALSADGRMLLVAEHTSHLLRTYDLAAGTLAAEIPLDTAPSAIAPLSRDGLLLLNPHRSGGEPFWIFDPRRPASAWFIPAEGR